VSIETDKVLSAIRRGEDSLPKLRAATGLEYAQLHLVLHELEFEWHSIDSHETAQGFQRFTVRGSEALSIKSKAVIMTNTAGRFGISVNREIRALVEALPVGTEIDTPRLRADLIAAHPELKAHEDDPLLSTYISQAVAPLRGTFLELVTKGSGGKPDLLRRVSNNGTKPRTEPAQPEHAREVKVDKSEDSEPSETLIEQVVECEQCGRPLEPTKKVNMGRCPECWSVYLKDCAARKRARAAKPEKNITNSLPDNGHELSTQLQNAIAEREAQISALQNDIDALKRVADMLQDYL
jgi:protein-arginine kinase activator protein McsA